MTALESTATRATRTGGADYAVAVAAIAGYIIVALRQSILPAKFFFDGDRIQAIAQGTDSSLGDKAFGNVAWVYAQLNLGGHPLVAGLVGYSAFLLIVLVVWARIRRDNPGFATVFVAGACIIFGAVNLGYYSKDVCVLPIVAAVLFLPKRWWADVVVIALMLGYAAWFRSYWLPVAVVYATYRLLRVQRRSLGFIALSIAVAVIALGLAIFVVYGTAPDIYRSTVNDTRTLDPNAQSLISPVLTFDEPWSGLLNNVITAFFLLVPLPLLFSGGGLYYVAITLVVTGIWGVTYVAIGRLHRLDVSTLSASMLIRAARASSLLLAFLCVQALFEPDYGSAVRHVTPLLPAALAVCRLALRRPGDSSAAVPSDQRAPHVEIRTATTEA